MNRGKSLVLCFPLVFQLAWGQDLDVRPVSVSISTPFTSYLYRGLDNPIDVAVPGIPCDAVSVRTSSGRITGENCSYIVNPGSDQRGDLTLWISWKNDAGGLNEESLRFRLKEIPAEAYFAGESSDADSLSTKAAKVAKGLIARVVGGGFDLTLQVTGFHLMLERSCQQFFNGSSAKAELTNEMSDALQTCAPGDRLHITQIMAKFPSGAVRALDDLRFVLY